MSDSDHMPLGAPPRKRLAFDPTINLGHLLTMATFVALGISTYFSLDKRITKQEDLAPFVQSARDATDARVQTQLTGLASDMKEMKTSVDKLTLSVQVQSAVQASKGSK